MSELASTRIVPLDGLRGIAVLLVFFDHTLQRPSGGYLGVDVFFALSGFLITSLIFAEIDRTGRLAFGRFFARRAVRLLPAFFATTGLYFGLCAIFASGQPVASLSRLPVILLASNLVPAPPFLSHIWSLSIEWQFYGVWPLLLVWLNTRWRRRQLAWLTLAAAAGFWITRSVGLNDMRIDGLLVGASFAALRHSPEWRTPALSAAAGRVLANAAVAAILGLAFASDYAGEWLPVWFGYLLIPLLATGLVFLGLQPHSRRSMSLLGSAPLAYFGRISYGLYLYHFPIAALMFAHGYSPAAMTVVGFAVSVPLADVSWRYLERPLLNVGHREAGWRLGRARVIG